MKGEGAMPVERNLAPSPMLTLVAGLPVLGCMLVMGLPAAVTESPGLPFRLFYTLAYLVWIVPLGALHRWLWRRGVGNWATVAVLLPASYAMSVINAYIALATLLSPAQRAKADWTWIFGGLDGCWLALIAFCGVQAIVLHRAALQRETERLHEAAQAARDAELRALRYQLQPHFLFNTLNAISALVHEERPRDATRMIARLGDFLRTTLEEGQGHEHTVADEIALTAAYLDIEKARLGERLRVEVSTAPGTLEARVPYLLLQPLVENAIRHGIAPSVEGGAVTIRFDRVGGLLRLVVSNDATAALPAVGRGVGLANVRARLAALHDGQHQLDAGMEGGLWVVRIAMPLSLARAPDGVAA
jgi:two-component system, LytTR family, sensor histidine kinase AlgZ